MTSSRDKRRKRSRHACKECRIRTPRPRSAQAFGLVGRLIAATLLDLEVGRVAVETGSRLFFTSRLWNAITIAKTTFATGLPFTPLIPMV
jgi:hypothetical protein